ncbi:MAG: hypothetical protein IJ189_11495 [Clostridia bacterium]|nr:hypothetical protein [Clostridia bacterium]
MLWKRVWSGLAAMVLALSCAGWAMAEGTKNAYVMAGFDDTNLRQWESNRFFIRMEELTGVSFSFRQYTDLAAWKSYKASLTKDGELPDVLFKAMLTPSECIDLKEKGVLIDLKPYLEKYAPHIWAILQEQKDALEAVTLPDGSIVALPYLNAVPAQNYIWINQQWLDYLRLDMPTTAEELVNVLTAFQTRDPNRNGKKDEIPLGFLGPFDLKFLAHAFGLICNDYNIFEQNGQVKFMPLEENYRLFVTWCRDLYQAGLLDSNGFSTADSLRRVTDKNATPMYGAIMTTVPGNLFQVTWAEQYTVVPPLTYEGKQVYRDFFGSVQRGTFAITSACASPETLLQWVDFLYTEEGAILSTAGQENIDYLVDGDGSWRLVEAAQSNSSAFIASELMDGGAAMPGITPSEFILRFNGQTDAYRANMEKQIELKSLCVRPFPYVSLTTAQEAEVTRMQNQLGAYVDVQLARWVLGEETISDASFEQFKNTLEEKGLSAFLAFWQDVLDHR